MRVSVFKYPEGMVTIDEDKVSRPRIKAMLAAYSMPTHAYYDAPTAVETLAKLIRRRKGFMGVLFGDGTTPEMMLDGSEGVTWTTTVTV